MICNSVQIYLPALGASCSSSSSHFCAPTRPLLVSAAPSRRARARAHHNSARATASVTASRRCMPPGVAPKAVVQHFDDAEICLAFPSPPASTDWPQFLHSPPIWRWWSDLQWQSQPTAAYGTRAAIHLAYGMPEGQRRQHANYAIDVAQLSISLWFQAGLLHSRAIKECQVPQLKQGNEYLWR